MIKQIYSRRIFLSILVSLLVIQLSFPVYAPVNPPNPISKMPLISVEDLLVDYTQVNVAGVSPDVINPAASIIYVRSTGQITDAPTEGAAFTYSFFQRMALGFVIADAVRIGAPLGVRGHSDLEVYTPEGILSFSGRIVGTADFDDAGPFWEELALNLQFSGLAKGGSSTGGQTMINYQVISLDIQGTLTRIGNTPEGQPIFDLELQATGAFMDLAYRSEPDIVY
jgi:hypothetical protein